jgi:Kef-type K+ transport system membrane component KefB
MEAAAPALAVAFIFLFGWLAEHSDIAAITGHTSPGSSSVRRLPQAGAARGGHCRRLFFVDVFFVNIGLMINLATCTRASFMCLLFSSSRCGQDGGLLLWIPHDGL